MRCFGQCCSERDCDTGAALRQTAPMANSGGNSDDISWEYLTPLFLQDLKYGLVMYECLGDPADLPLAIVRIFDRTVDADAYEDTGEVDPSAESLLSAQEMLEAALADSSLRRHWPGLRDARRRLRMDFISARKAIEPTWVSEVEYYATVSQEEAPELLLPLFEAAETADEAVSDVLELTGMRLMLAHIQELLLSAHHGDYPKLAALHDRLAETLPDVHDLDLTVNLAVGFPIEGDAEPSPPWQITEGEVEPLRAAQESVLAQEVVVEALRATATTLRADSDE